MGTGATYCREIVIQLIDAAAVHRFVGRLGLVVTSASCNTSSTAKTTNAKLFEKLQHVQ